MTESQESKGVPPAFSDPRVQAWMAENLTDLEKSVTGHRILYTSLLIGFLVGLVAHIAGYILLSSAPKEPLGLFADLLHALGWSLWTGVVVVVFVQIIPEAKRRQIRAALDAYKAFQGDEAQGGNDTQVALEKSGEER